MNGQVCAGDMVKRPHWTNRYLLVTGTDDETGTFVARHYTRNHGHDIAGMDSPNVWPQDGRWDQVEEQAGASGLPLCVWCDGPIMHSATTEDGLPSKQGHWFHYDRVFSDADSVSCQNGRCKAQVTK